MKFVAVIVCAIVFFAFQSTDAIAKEKQEYLTEADQYYQEQNFKKAYEIYYKLAKTGDQFCQYKVSQMYAKGGTSDILVYLLKVDH